MRIENFDSELAALRDRKQHNVGIGIDASKLSDSLVKNHHSRTTTLLLGPVRELRNGDIPNYIASVCRGFQHCLYRLKCGGLFGSDGGITFGKHWDR